MPQIEERTAEGMRVVKSGRGFYYCHSESQPNVAYVVDVLDYEGLGSCTCDDFNMRRLPRWRGSKRKLDAFRCKHIVRVRNHVLDISFAPYVRTEAQTKSELNTN